MTKTVEPAERLTEWTHVDRANEAVMAETIAHALSKSSRVCAADRSGEHAFSLDEARATIAELRGVEVVHNDVQRALA